MGLLDQWKGKKLEATPLLGGATQALGLLGDAGTMAIRELDKRNKAMARPFTDTSPEAQKQAVAAAMDFVGMAPVGMTKIVPRTEAFRIAQANAAKPVSEGGLGLRPDNTAMERAQAMGAIDAYHGTADDIVQIDPKMFGTSTGANSAKQAFWAVDQPNTARGYAEYAATGAPVKRLVDEADTYERIAQRNSGSYAQKYWDKYDEALQKAQDLETSIAENSLRGQNIMPLKLLPQKPVSIDAAGAEFTDFERGVNSFVRDAKRGGNDLAAINNLADDVAFNGRPANHFAVLNPAIVRSRFAAFDPARRMEADLLGYADPRLLGGIAGGGLLGGYLYDK